ncbi:MAG: esterase [Homoserinimonas sp.]|jgi:phospholipase/carboxylesterase|nr:esterase [Homoserinimonas sp.]
MDQHQQPAQPSLPIDDEAVVWSAPQSELATRPLVVLLHGRGSHEHDLFTLVPMLPSEPVYASLRAPMPFPGAGFSWFTPGAPGAPDSAVADAAVKGVLDWLDRLAPANGIAVLGFSQGGALVTHLMRHAPERFASYINLAGFTIPGDAPADSRLLELRPPLFWGRDVADPVIPQSAIDRTAAWLPSHSTLTARHYAGIGHSIAREEVDEASEFLRATLLSAG